MQINASHAFAASLKACAQQKNARRGSDIHAEVARLGLLDKCPYVGSSLVDMYARCGLLAKAQHVFRNLRYQDIVSWNVLMTACANCGNGGEVLKAYEELKLAGFFPDAISFVCSLRACAITGAFHKGRQIHTEISNEGLLQTNIYVGSALVDMYAKFGALSTAHQVLDNLPTQSLETYNSLISGYAEQGHGEEAIKCFKQMQIKGLTPNSITMVCILKVCVGFGEINDCLKVHAEIARVGILEGNVIVGTSLVDMYAKRRFLAKAREVFDELPVPNIVSWTALIAGYADQGHGEKALECFQGMLQAGFTPDTTTLACSLKACGRLLAADKGREIHAEVERRELLRKDSTLANTLVDMYVKCGLLAYAQEVFSGLPVRDVASWTALIAGYVENEDSVEALKHFDIMQLDGVSPNAVTLACSLKACGSIGDLVKGQEVHAEVGRKGLEADLTIGNTLIDMYAKCGLVSKAQDVFERLLQRDVVSWNALISAYGELGLGEEALACFRSMQTQGFCPDHVTFVCILKACASLGADVQGRELHGEIARKGLLKSSVILGSILVDMYAKCGLLPVAEEVFENLPIRDVVAWNSLIGGYAQLGLSTTVFYIFGKMLGECVKPDVVTFLVVLSACSCTGLAYASGTYFEAMSKNFGIIPALEHHSCMVNVLSREGDLDEAVNTIRKMPFCPNVVVWNTMLSACKISGNIKLGIEAFGNVLSLDSGDSAAYVLMSQIVVNGKTQNCVH